MAKNKHQARMAFIFVTIMLDMIGIGLIIPSLPDVLKRFLSDPYESSRYYGYFISIYALMQFVASPLLGAISDVVGRRPVLLLSLLTAGLDYVLMAFAPTLGILFGGRVLSGLTGANITVAMAYIADVSNEKNRAANFGLMGAAFGLGFIIGPALGGLLGNHGPAYPFLLAAGMNLLNFLFGLFVLPESLSPSHRRKFQWGKTNPLHSIVRMFQTKEIVALLVVHFLIQLAGQTHPSVWTLYTQTRFQWTVGQIGFSLAIVGLLSAIVQGGLTGVIVPRIGERRAVLIGTIGSAVTFFAFGAITEGWMLYPVLVISAVFWVYQPAMQSLLTHQARPEEQGELQGCLVSLTSLASILNPLVTTALFAHYTRPGVHLQLPGAPYYFAAAISAIGLPILLLKRTKA